MAGRQRGADASTAVQASAGRHKSRTSSGPACSAEQRGLLRLQSSTREIHVQPGLVLWPENLTSPLSNRTPTAAASHAFRTDQRDSVQALQRPFPGPCGSSSLSGHRGTATPRGQHSQHSPVWILRACSEDRLLAQRRVLCPRKTAGFHGHIPFLHIKPRFLFQVDVRHF